MKVEDYNTIAAEVRAQLQAGSYTIVEMIGEDLTVWAVASIYYSNDLTHAFTMHIEAIAPVLGTGDITLITTPRKCSTIYGKRAARWTQDRGEGNIVQYEDLTLDVAAILNVIQINLQQVL